MSSVKKTFDIVIIGGGLVGFATARSLKLENPSLNICVLEKEKSLAAHQSGRNSGVIHSGLYYKPGSSKATMCRQGREKLIEFAARRNVKFDLCGKIIVARDESESTKLSSLLKNGETNGLQGLELINSKTISKYEPNIRGNAALVVPEAGIIDFPGILNELKNEFVELGGEVELRMEVVNVKKQSVGGYAVELISGYSIHAHYLINCAGLHCDKICKMTGLDPEIKIIPFRGDYYELTDSAKKKINNLVYPVPDSRFPFLGVHFTRMINGNVECGPNAVLALKKEGYRKSDFSFSDAFDFLSYSGTRSIVKKYWQYGIKEYKTSLHKNSYLKLLQNYMPTLQSDDIVPGRAGIRAQAVAPDGRLLDDFHFKSDEFSFHVLNAPSPAATSCLAIGDYVAGLVSQKASLVA